MHADISVVVPTHNRSARLERLVRALEAQTLAPAEVVVVDDGSGDDTPKVLEQLAETSSLRLRTLRLDPAHGPAVARNRGWQSTTTPYVAFTDDDCVPSARWLREVAAALERDPTVGIVQGTVLPDPSAKRRNWAATREILEPSPWFEGCNLALRRAALDASDGFGERLRMGGEDTWLGWSVLRAGWNRSFSREAVVYHDVTYPGYSWHLNQAKMNGNVSPLVKQFPELRREFWRPWALRAAHPALAVGLVGLALTPRHPAASLLAAPYAYLRGWQRRTNRPDVAWFRDTAMLAIVDAAEMLSTTRLAIRERIVLI